MARRSSFCRALWALSSRHAASSKGIVWRESAVLGSVKTRSSVLVRCRFRSIFRVRCSKSMSCQCNPRSSPRRAPRGERQDEERVKPMSFGRVEQPRRLFGRGGRDLVAPYLGGAALRHKNASRAALDVQGSPLRARLSSFGRETVLYGRCTSCPRGMQKADIPLAAG